MFFMEIHGNASELQKISRNWFFKWIGLSEDKKFDSLDSLKIFFLFSTLPMIVEVSGKSTHLVQKCYFYHKTTNKQS